MLTPDNVSILSRDMKLLLMVFILQQFAKWHWKVKDIDCTVYDFVSPLLHSTQAGELKKQQDKKYQPKSMNISNLHWSFYQVDSLALHTMLSLSHRQARVSVGMFKLNTAWSSSNLLSFIFMMKKICSYYCVKNLPLLLPSGKSYSSYSCHYCSACFSWYQFGTTSLFATKKKALVNYTGHPKYVPFFLLHYILTTRHLVYVSQLRISLK